MKSCAALFFGAMASLSAFGAGEQRPFPQHVVYAPGTIQPSAPSQAELDQAVADFYRAWKKKYLCADNAGRRYVFCNAEKMMIPAKVCSVSEGQGYGMLVAVLMAGADPEAKADFDGLYRFFRAHPAENHADLMAWRQVSQGKGRVLTVGKDDRESATDGDLDIACALLMADRQWGSTGAIDYRKEAGKVLAAILRAEADPQHHTLTLGSWVAGESLRSRYRGALRTSDFMPAHLKSFAAATDDPRWTQIADATYRLLEGLVAAYSPHTGLLPDFVQWKAGGHRPAPPGFMEGRHDGCYFYNACRAPWRVGMDALLTGDPRARALLARLNTWAEKATGGDPQKINAGYRLDGHPLKGDRSAAFIGPLAVAAMSDPARRAWLNALWSDLVGRKPDAEDYYGNSVKLLTMIVISGNWWQ